MKKIFKVSEYICVHCIISTILLMICLLDIDARKKGFIVGPQFDSKGQPLFDGTAGAPVVINPKIPKLIIDGSHSFQQIRMSGARVGKFEIKKGALQNLSNDFPLFRYADVLLMKAEALVRQGKNGDHRRQDLIRFGKFLDAWWEKPASDSKRTTFPIPQWAIDANPNLAN